MWLSIDPFLRSALGHHALFLLASKLRVEVNGWTDMVCKSMVEEGGEEHQTLVWAELCFPSCLGFQDSGLPPGVARDLETILSLPLPRSPESQIPGFASSQTGAY